MEKTDNNDTKKATAKANSLQYKERFQFVLYIQDKTRDSEEGRSKQIVCQRYFNIVGFNYRSIESVELLHTMQDIAWLIKEELQAKSRIFMWHNEDLPMQLTGFDGKEKKTWFTYPDEVPANKFLDKGRPEPYSVVFGLDLLLDEKPVYEFIWDASQYPSYVRNSVDISNSDDSYRHLDVQSMSFAATLASHMTSGRGNLVTEIIRQLCNAMSNEKGKDRRKYTRDMCYSASDGAKWLSTSVWAMNQKYVSDWEKAVEKKTSEYFSNLYPSTREIDRINRL